MPLAPKKYADAVAEATAYNKAIKAPWRQIQTVIGTRIDGLPGDDTSAALLSWQERHSLPATGKIDSATMHSIDHSPEPSRACLHDLELGVWLDWSHIIAGLPAQKRRLDLLERLGVKHLMAFAISSGHEYKWKPDHLATYAEEASSRGMTLGVSGYMSTKREVLEQQMLYLDSLCSEVVPDSLEADQEGQHRASRVEGFESLQAASKAIVDGMAALSKKHGFKTLKVTTHPFHPEFRSPTIVKDKRITHIVNQAYTAAEHKDRPVTIGDSQWGAGPKQRWACDQVWPFDPRIEEMGFAVYGQEFLGHTLEFVIREQLGVLSNRGVKRVFAWSEKWLDDNNEIARVIRSIFGGSR